VHHLLISYLSSPSEGSHVFLPSHRGYRQPHLFDRIGTHVGYRDLTDGCEYLVSFDSKDADEEGGHEDPRVRGEVSKALRGWVL
jgi:hypothetical protein